MMAFFPRSEIYINNIWSLSIVLNVKTIRLEGFIPEQVYHLLSHIPNLWSGIKGRFVLAVVTRSIYIKHTHGHFQHSFEWRCKSRYFSLATLNRIRLFQIGRPEWYRSISTTEADALSITRFTTASGTLRYVVGPGKHGW